MDARPPAARATFVLSFDFEDWHQLVLRRIGRSDWREGSDAFERHVATLLDLLDELGLSATFFVVGVTADRHPAALEDVVARGHELGCHGYEHRRAFRQTPAEFEDDVRRGVDAIERTCGVAPVGYRAPWCSITRDSRWALDILRRLGFVYDSSLYDSPRIPRRIQPIPVRPYRIGGGDGLWEFPIAVWRHGRLVLPVGGGAYWRVLPDTVLWPSLESVGRRTKLPVLYFHPYEFAPERLRVALPADATRKEQVREAWRSFSKNARRDLIRPRLEAAAQRFRLVPFRDVIGTVADDYDARLLQQPRAHV